MRDEDSQRLTWSHGRFSDGSAWSMLIVLLGLFLWAQLFSLPFLDELRFTDHNAAATISYMLPLVVLVPGALFRVPVLNLLVFPICFIPGVLLLPERSIVELEQGFSMLRIGITVAAYVGIAAAGATRAQAVGEVDSTRPSKDEPAEHVGGIYPFYFVVRAAILVGLLLVTQYAAFHDPQVAASIAEHYSDRPQAAATFIALLAFFAWCVAAYTMFFVPLMNLEYDVRKLSRSIDGMLDGGRRARWARVGLWAVIAAGTVAAAWTLI